MFIKCDLRHSIGANDPRRTTLEKYRQNESLIIFSMNTYPFFICLTYMYNTSISYFQNSFLICRNIIKPTEKPLAHSSFSRERRGLV